MSWIVGALLKHWLKAVIIVAALAAVGGIYRAGFNAAWRIAEVETLKAKIASQQRDVDAARILRERDAATLAEQDEQARLDEQTNEALRKALATRGKDDPRGLNQLELDLLLGKRK